MSQMIEQKEFHVRADLVQLGNVPKCYGSRDHSPSEGIDETKGYFRRNSDCSTDQKTLGIPFRTIPRRRKILGIPNRRTEKEVNFRNFVPEQFVEKKTAQNSIP
jgi:hypothetical protein